MWAEIIVYVFLVCSCSVMFPCIGSISVANIMSMFFFGYLLSNENLPSRELTYPPDKAYLKIIFLFPRWDMLISWRVYSTTYVFAYQKAETAIESC